MIFLHRFKYSINNTNDLNVTFWASNYSPPDKNLKSLQVIIIDMNYNKKNIPGRIRSRILRHKRVRYHNDAALFPDDTQKIDRKRRKALKKSASEKNLFN